MKTLDEVIKIFSAFATYQPELYEGPAQSTVADAVHYLKEYKKKWLELQNLTQENLFKTQKLNDRIARYEEAIKNCEEAENKYKQMENSIALMILKKGDEVLVMDDNPVLTWDQLKGMKGKPVWVEGYYPSAWYIVREVQKSKDGTEDIILDGFQGLTGIGRDDRYGNVENGWQAYRKEK